MIIHFDYTLIPCSTNYSGPKKFAVAVALSNTVTFLGLFTKHYSYDRTHTHICFNINDLRLRMHQSIHVPPTHNSCKHASVYEHTHTHTNFACFRREDRPHWVCPHTRTHTLSLRILVQLWTYSSGSCSRGARTNAYPKFMSCSVSSSHRRT